MPWVDRVGNRRSWAILAQDFFWKTPDRHKTADSHAGEGSRMRSFCFLLFLPSGAGRGGPQRSRARRFSGAAERTLDGKDRCESMGAGGKDLFSSMQDICHHGGKDE